MHATLLCCLLLPSVLMAADDFAALDAQITRLQQELATLPERPPAQPSARAGFHSHFVSTTQAARWVQVDLGAVRAFDSVVVVPAFFEAAGEGSGVYGMPPRFRVDVSDDASFAAYQTLADRTEADVPASPSPLFIPAAVKGRYVRFTATRLAQQRLGRGFFALGELFVFAGPLNIAAGAAVTSSGAYETAPTWMLGNLTDGQTHLGPPVTADAARSNGWHSGIDHTASEAKWVQVDLGASQPLDELRLYPAHPPDFPERPGFGFPPRFKVEAADEPGFEHPRLLLDFTGADFPNPADNPVAIPVPGLTTRYVRMTATRLWERTGDYVFALSELEAWSKGQNVALGKQISSLDQTTTGSWNGAMLVDGRTSLGIIKPWLQWLSGLSRRQEVTAELAALNVAKARLTARHRELQGMVAAAAIVLACLAGVWMHFRQRRQQKKALSELRRQIARDLHDEIGSSLGSIALMSEMALRDGDFSAMQDVHRLSREAAESMRGIIWLVREPGVPGLDRLVETMRHTAASLLGGMDWQLDAPAGKTPPAPSLDFHRHVFLFFKEAVHNIARHAHAKTVGITVSWARPSFLLTVQDDGAGFDPAAACGGSGLDNLRHRAQALKGSVEILSRPGEGCRVQLTAPLQTS